ncbi:hypothetical protein M8494_19055 [Serratia ureilytica]
MPENDEGLWTRLADWLGRPEAVDTLRRRELRQLSKTTLRELAQLADSEELKGLLKIRQRKALEVICTAPICWTCCTIFARRTRSRWRTC